MTERSNSTALAIVPKSLTEVQSLAETLAKSDLMPAALKGKVPDVVVQIITGQELGLSPMAAIRGVHVVDGKPILAADTMVALCLGSGICEYFTCVEDTDQCQTYETERKGAPAAQRASFSMTDAKKAAINLKDNWRTHPRPMMKARAKAALARDVYPDVLAGCYDPDEITVPATAVTPPLQRESKHADVEDAEIVSETADAPELAMIDACETVDSLKALAGTLGKLKGAVRSKAKQLYDARMTFLIGMAGVHATDTTEPTTETAA